MSTAPTNELHASSCHDALVALLRPNLVGVDVDAISDKDFDNEDLVLRPPSVRVLYAGTVRTRIESQSVNYEAVHRFLILCGDEDRRSAADQARASLQLSERAESVIAGARLRLPTQEETEPLTLGDREPMAVLNLGTAFATAVECPGPQQFPAAFAFPAAYSGESNG